MEAQPNLSARPRDEVPGARAGGPDHDRDPRRLPGPAAGDGATCHAEQRTRRAVGGAEVGAQGWLPGVDAEDRTDPGPAAPAGEGLDRRRGRAHLRGRAPSVVETPADGPTRVELGDAQGRDHRDGVELDRRVAGADLHPGDGRVGPQERQGSRDTDGRRGEGSARRGAREPAVGIPESRGREAAVVPATVVGRRDEERGHEGSPAHDAAHVRQPLPEAGARPVLAVEDSRPRSHADDLALCAPAPGAPREGAERGAVAAANHGRPCGEPGRTQENAEESLVVRHPHRIAAAQNRRPTDDIWIPAHPPDSGLIRTNHGPDAWRETFPVGLLLDPVDASWASRWRWKVESAGYARRDTWRDGKRAHVYLHLAVLERKLGRPVAPGLLCDHVNGNRLDNRRENLRGASTVENSINVRSSSRRWRGVFRHHKVQRFEARLGCGERRADGKARPVSLGLFATEVEAAAAVDLKLDELGWVTARNFATPSERLLSLRAVEEDRAHVGLSRDLLRVRALIAGELPPVNRRTP